MIFESGHGFGTMITDGAPCQHDVSGRPQDCQDQLFALIPEVISRSRRFRVREFLPERKAFKREVSHIHTSPQYGFAMHCQFAVKFSLSSYGSIAVDTDQLRWAMCC
jgi:hypothetical protein